MQIDKVTQNIHKLSKTIEQYKSLKPECYGLLEMTLEEIFGGVTVIEPLAFPVWQKLLAAYHRTTSRRLSSKWLSNSVMHKMTLTTN